MRHIIRPLAILIVRFLQYRYKHLSTSERYWAGRPISRLQLLQAVLYFFKQQFNAWGYFHPDCSWSEKDERQFRKLFPEKDFDEVEVVVWHNPEAVTYYHNRIFNLMKGRGINYEREIGQQLRKWKKWN